MNQSAADVRVRFHHDDPPDWVGFSTQSLDGVALVEGRLDEFEGKLVLTSLEFTALDPAGGGGVTSSTLRALRLEAVLAQVRGQVLTAYAQEFEYEDASVIAEWRQRVQHLALAAAEQKATGKRGYGDDFYRLVALEYVALTEQGKGGRGALRRLADVMAQRMGEKEARSRDNIRDWVAEARRRNFLSPGEPGRGGGGPGWRLYETQEEE